MAEENEQILSFHGVDLVNLLCKYYQIARICDAVGDEFYDLHGDPMTSNKEMNKFRQEIADKLMALDKRKDGTIIFEDTPFIVTTEIDP